MYHTRGGTWDHNKRGENFLEDDWDNLIILDACRHDMFKQLSYLEGTLTHRTSMAASTEEFLKSGLVNKQYYDTVYVTANPMFERNIEQLNQPFHAVINVWAEDGWDDEHNTVLPETMTEYVLRASEQYPNKRIIAHYIQPHYPFISANGINTGRPDPLSTGGDFWSQIRTGEISISREKIWRAYKENLEHTLPHVERLVAELSGKSVVTSDHGNMVGERARPIPVREWGHPPGMYTYEIVTVPWLETPFKSRKTVTEEPPREDRSETNESVVTERLRQLGYVDT
jgi:hypothetical protein